MGHPSYIKFSQCQHYKFMAFKNKDKGNSLTVIPQMKMWDRRTSQTCFSHPIIRHKIPTSKIHMESIILK